MESRSEFGIPLADPMQEIKEFPKREYQKLPVYDEPKKIEEVKQPEPTPEPVKETPRPKESFSSIYTEQPNLDFGNYPILNKVEEKKYFWKIYAIILTIIIIASLGALAFFIKDGKLTPQFNATSDITNNYDFTPTVNSPVTSNIDNKYNNTYEINFDLSDEFIEKVCGNSS